MWFQCGSHVVTCNSHVDLCCLFQTTCVSHVHLCCLFQTTCVSHVVRVSPDVIHIWPHVINMLFKCGKHVRI